MNLETERYPVLVVIRQLIKPWGDTIIHFSKRQQKQ